MDSRQAQRPSWQPDEDRELLDKIRDGRLDLFHELVRRHESAIFRGALAILGNAADAEDVMQETFLRAFRSLDQFRGDAKFRTWLIKIAVNVACSRLKEIRADRWEPLDVAICKPAARAWQLPTCMASPEEEYARKELGSMIMTALDGLHSRYRSVLYMRDVEDLSTGATASALGMSEECVRTALRRARAQLRFRVQRILAKT
jgi:RNA polymerase sigma-70 factor (ECF subfamily)